jgi:hypothetical protein
MLLLLVQLSMPLQIIQSCKRFTTLWTFMGPQPSMAQLVVALVESTCECLVAQGACEDGLLALRRCRCAELVGQVTRLGVEGASVSRTCECGCSE